MGFRIYIVGVIIALSSIVGLSRDLLAQQSAASTEPEGEKIDMHRLASADPDRDFAHNKKTGNIYFLAVRGFTTEIPGIEGDDERYLKAAKTIVI